MSFCHQNKISENLKIKNRTANNPTCEQLLEFSISLPVTRTLLEIHPMWVPGAVVEVVDRVWEVSIRSQERQRIC